MHDVGALLTYVETSVPRTSSLLHSLLHCLSSSYLSESCLNASRFSQLLIMTCAECPCQQSLWLRSEHFGAVDVVLCWCRSASWGEAQPDSSFAEPGTYQECAHQLRGG